MACDVVALDEAQNRTSFYLCLVCFQGGRRQYLAFFSFWPGGWFDKLKPCVRWIVANLGSGERG